jgi:hypothetical protein
MPIRFLPLATGLLPIVAIHASLLLAINAGAIPACIPYIDGCASISATGRYEPAVFVFKPSMTIQAALLTAYWYVAVGWLRSLSGQHQQENAGRSILVFGAASSIALIIYVTFLGTQTPLYEFMRRFGIYFYFLFMVIAQITLAVKTLRLAKAKELQKVRRIARLQLWLALFPCALGVLNLTLKATLDEPDAAENIIEWIAALMMQTYFVLSWISWRTTQFGNEWKTVTD